MKKVLKWLGIGFAGIIVIAILSSAFGGNSDKPKQEPAKTTTAPTTQQTVTTPQTPTQPPTVIPTPPAQTQKNEVTVYVTNSGKKYHRAGCQYLSKSKIPMSLSGAKESGYGPCSKCNPPI